jgi:hypothetical protein
VALAEEVVDVLASVRTTDELTKHVAEVSRLYSDTLVGPPAGPDPGPAALR